MDYDIFISHASENKSAIALPLAERLREHGVRVWLDVFELKLGDSLSRSIDKGLARSRFGIVILSPEFFRKPWPRRELDGLITREIGSEKVILPVWHNITRDEIVKYSPPLADKLGVLTTHGLDYVVEWVLQAIRETPHEQNKYIQNLLIHPLPNIDESGSNAKLLKWAARGVFIGPIVGPIVGSFLDFISLGYISVVRNILPGIIFGLVFGPIISPVIYLFIKYGRKLIKYAWNP